MLPLVLLLLASAAQVYAQNSSVITNATPNSVANSQAPPAPCGWSNKAWHRRLCELLFRRRNLVLETKTLSIRIFVAASIWIAFASSIVNTVKPTIIFPAGDIFSTFQSVIIFSAVNIFNTLEFASLLIFEDFQQFGTMLYAAHSSLWLGQENSKQRLLQRMWRCVKCALRSVV
ncbi:hypothetical protein BT63DRAFT_459845 [Microthyrium microscopicum]|uniref:Uncharacterized protein n=1 Tax=Microthyrium microscopicum TaxID=703497 RepID=A0A6A6TZF7_9PEZI|nr:hypothetical protein BT63DRAFT_459845 [Microthyrium microscopicum]